MIALNVKYLRGVVVRQQQVCNAACPGSIVEHLRSTPQATKAVQKRLNNARNQEHSIKRTANEELFQPVRLQS